MLIYTDMSTPSPVPPASTDRILPLTRAVAAAVIPFLWLAFVILFFLPEETGRRFAWEINPPLQAMYMGAGYLGGSLLFLHTVLGRRWHRVAPGFPAITAFTISMLLLTVMHWERFDLGHLGFQLWLILYIVTPFLVPWLWWGNRAADPGTAGPGDVLVPRPVRLALGLLGGGLLLYALITFAVPEAAVRVWPWTLTPLAARVLSGWMALLGVGGVVISREPRWSGWRVGLQAIGLWHALFLIAAVLRREDFTGGQLLNWYVLSVVTVLVGMVWLYLTMERRQARG
ncbi:MAG: hypothetical protein RRC07_04205 [Anaerolineae bacterium]|nr:hypothetical protein [Anaerolineae bacterium]